MFPQKNKSKKLKGFTLIELLMAIAIIGILSSVILVRLVDSRGKAKDAAIMKSANALMKMAQMNAAATGSYTPWLVGWFPNNSCDVLGTRLSNNAIPDWASAVEACKNIVENVGDAGYTTNPALYKLYITSTNNVANPEHPKLSIMAALPYEKKFYCIGSNGGISKNTGLNSGCPGKAGWECSGCQADPNGGGN